ncbi:MAG: Rieske 2Fe-2S domain-containing protein [Planctomycetota bacterium]
MLRRILALFRRQGVLVPDVSNLLEGEARKIDIGDVHAGGTRVILCRVDGEVFALDSRCPHDGGEITTGPLAEGKYAVCPLHRYRFDPKTGKAVDVLCRAARKYRVEPRGVGVEVFARGAGSDPDGRPRGGNAGGPHA